MMYKLYVSPIWKTYERADYVWTLMDIQIKHFFVEIGKLTKIIYTILTTTNILTMLKSDKDYLDLRKTLISKIPNGL